MAEDREQVYRQIIDELFSIAQPGPLKNALWQRYQRLLTSEHEEQPEMYLCPYCGQHHPISTRDWYCPLDSTRPKESKE